MAKKDKPKEVVSHIRKTKDITPDQWANEINSDNIKLSNKLDEVAASLVRN